MVVALFRWLNLPRRFSMKRIVFGLGFAQVQANSAVILLFALLCKGRASHMASAARSRMLVFAEQIARNGSLIRLSDAHRVQ